MRNSEHPAYHNVSRKFRHYHTLLANLEAPLREDGFNYDAESLWASTHMQKLSDLEEPAPPQTPDPARLQAASAPLEPELFQRMGDTLKFLRVHVPDHPYLPPYLLYYQLWKDGYGEPLRPLTPADLQPLEEAPEPVIATAIHGVIYDRINAAQLAFVEMDKSPQKNLTPLLIFVSGLFYAAGYFDRHQTSPVHTFDDGLLEVARESLEAAVDFANAPGTIAEARKNPLENLPESQRLLFMATYHVSIAQSPAVYEWLHRWYYLRDLTSMFFAMGVRSLHDPYAKNLIQPWLEDSNHLNLWLPLEAQPYLLDFLNND